MPTNRRSDGDRPLPTRFRATIVLAVVLVLFLVAGAVLVGLANNAPEPRDADTQVSNESVTEPPYVEPVPELGDE